MANGTPSFFNVPPSKVIEVVYVQLADGRVVARTPDELEELPDEVAPPIVARQQP